MTKFAKLLKKLMEPGTVISFQELEYILGKLGYQIMKTGKTSGSRRAYINPESKHVIRIHKPHSGNELKTYARDYIFEELKKQKLI